LDTNTKRSSLAIEKRTEELLKNKRLFTRTSWQAEFAHKKKPQIKIFEEETNLPLVLAPQKDRTPD
jgi:hypothetical protein